MILFVFLIEFLLLLIVMSLIFSLLKLFIRFKLNWFKLIIFIIFFIILLFYYYFFFNIFDIVYIFFILLGIKNVNDCYWFNFIYKYDYI